MWFLFGRDPKVEKKFSFYPPEGMTPAEVGYMITGEMIHEKFLDMLYYSMLMYFAGKGYLEFHELKKRKYELWKVKDPKPGDEKGFVITLFNSIFPSSCKKEIDGKQVSVTNLKKLNRFDVFSQISELYQNDDAIFTERSKTCRNITTKMVICEQILMLIIPILYMFQYDFEKAVIHSAVVTVLALIFFLFSYTGLWEVFHAYDYRLYRSPFLTVSHFVFGCTFIFVDLIFSVLVGIVYLDMSSRIYWLLYFLLALVSTGLLGFLGTIMRARTPKSAERMAEILGFRDYIKDAQIDQLKELQNSNQDYFFRVMPYACVMGLDRSWTKRFKRIKIERPEWYISFDEGYRDFSPYWYYGMTRSARKTSSEEKRNSSKTFSIKDFFGDSGSGGGSYSGGGFGGGGGGAW